MERPEWKKKIVSYMQENKGKKFTAREIAETLADKYPKECERKIQKSKQIDTHNQTREQIQKRLVDVLTAEVSTVLGRDIKAPELKVITNPKPQKYYWTDENTDESEKNELKDSKRSYEQREKELYEPLIKYLKDELKVEARRIEEGNSSNTHGKRGNHLLHPDIVGVESLIDSDWVEEIQTLADLTNRKKARLWSFEVKEKTKFSSVREDFLQAVSNSSWANLGYLVVGEIEGSNTKKEARMLADLYGIGLITIDIEQQDGNIEIQAQERDEIDLAACNRLARENTGFRRFIREAKKEYK